VVTTNYQNKRILLISNSTPYGSGYLEHAEDEIRDFLGHVGKFLFVPFALCHREAYAALARERLKAMGYDLNPLIMSKSRGRLPKTRKPSSSAAAIPFAL
jgi:peptidase E